MPPYRLILSIDFINIEILRFSFFVSAAKVQVKSSIPIPKSNGGIPFTLQLKDPMQHIESLNENPKYAIKTSSNNDNDPSSFHNDCFNVVIPEQEKYFSLLKYRCKNDLRPVPIVSHVIAEIFVFYNPFDQSP